MTVTQKAATKNEANNAAFLEWWTYLTGDGDPNKRRSGQIAELRRAQTVEEIYLDCPAFGLLRRRFPFDLQSPIGRRNLDRVAIIAHVLSFVRENDGSLPIGKQLATPCVGKARAPVTDDRFRRLVKVSRDDEIMAHFRRLVDLLGNRANVESLGRLILSWGGQKTMKKFSIDYYDVLQGVVGSDSETAKD